MLLEFHHFALKMETVHIKKDNPCLREVCKSCTSGQSLAACLHQSKCIVFVNQSEYMLVCAKSFSFCCTVQ